MRTVFSDFQYFFLLRRPYFFAFERIPFRLKNEWISPFECTFFREWRTNDFLGTIFFPFTFTRSLSTLHFHLFSVWSTYLFLPMSNGFSLTLRRQKVRINAMTPLYYSIFYLIISKEECLK